MKVVCPHCRASYGIDDRRIPDKGLNVRCPKCRDTFPVRKTAAAEAAVPLPAPPVAAPAVSPEPQRASAVPLPAPSAPLAPPPSAAPAPLPSPFDLAPPAPLAVDPPDLPVPLPAPPGAFAAAAAPGDGLSDDPLPAGPGDLASPAGSEPFAPSAPFATEGPPVPPEPEAFPPAPEPVPLPELAAPELAAPELDAPEPLPVPPAPGEPLAFGEVDLAGEPPAPAAPGPDPFASAPSPSAPTDPPPPAEELEMLFGEGAPKAAAGSAAEYRVRRRSGKIFGPFEEAQVVDMLAKGELMGNEDVSPDGGQTWSALGAVAAFGEVLRRVTSSSPVAPAPAHDRVGGAPPELQRGAAFGDRMAGGKVLEGIASTRRRPRTLVAAAAVLVALVGAGAGLTRYGFFFLKAFRRGDSARVAALLAEARAPLDRAEYAGDRAALAAAARAVAADPDSPEAAAVHAMVVATLELRHGAPPEALEQARRAADRLDAEAREKVPARAARLASTLVSSPGAATLPHETALEQAAAKAAPDPEVVALLARSALARGDAPHAAARFAQLERLRPGSVRAAHGAALAALAARDVAAARAALARALAANPGHLPSLLELAAIAEASGEGTDAEARLAQLLAPEAEAQLAPAERARALVLRGALLARASARHAEAEQAFEAAAKADPRLVEARVALAEHRLHRGDAAGAVAALDPMAGQAGAVPALGAVRIRALSAVGRALDASILADQALARSPGDPALLLAKAAALDAAGKDDQAIALYRDASARDPGAFEPRLALGRIALERRDLAQARVELAAAAEKGPREPAAHAALAELALAEGDAGQAEKAFEAALAVDPEFASAEVGLARLALARGDAQGARVRVERALAVDPRSVEGHVTHGALLWKAKDLPGAERAFQVAVDLDARNAAALWRLGAVKLERGEDVDGAVRRLTAASNEEPGTAEIRDWLGRALLAKGETPGAISQLRKAVELDPGSPAHRVHLGVALERSGALVEAIEEYRAAAVADPRFTEAHERLAVLYAGNGQYLEAAAAYEKAIASEPRAARLRIALADCRVRLGKYDDAARGYREVMRADPSAVQVFYKLARALHQGHGAKVALPWYERAARVESANPMPHYYLGYLYKERGQAARAVAEFRRFLQLKPDADEKRDIEAEIEDLGGR
jgi:predicted Zn finger-like uncharacterized protein